MKRRQLCLKSCFQAWFSKKGVLETLISCLRFLHIYSCVVLQEMGTHKHNNNLRYVSKLYPFPFKLFILCMFALSFWKILKFCRFLGFLRTRPRQENLPWPLLKLLSSKLRSFQAYNSEMQRGIECKKISLGFQLLLNKFFLHSTCVGTFELKVQKLVQWPNAIFFVRSLQLSTSKVGGQMQTNLHSTCLGAFKLGVWKLL